MNAAVEATTVTKMQHALILLDTLTAAVSQVTQEMEACVQV